MESAITLVRQRLGLTNQQFAAHLGIDGSQWGKAVRGVEGHVPFGRLIEKAPEGFWPEFLPMLAAHFGMSVVGGDGLGQSIARLLHVAADVVARLDARQEDRKVG